MSSTCRSSPFSTYEMPLLVGAGVGVVSARTCIWTSKTAGISSAMIDLMANDEPIYLAAPAGNKAYGACERGFENGRAGVDKQESISRTVRFLVSRWMRSNCARYTFVRHRQKRRSGFAGLQMCAHLLSSGAAPTGVPLPDPMGARRAGRG